ncbi:hypothetical protein U9M48_015700 [Paspalum notatum var. saurae]|uniref:At1g61320/AtMIF1 LRR domain-containing protein n=1 Tax=Paspalum notatum var. saurae TaxID=547442 RepID=A0AAQ3WM64_PASNO
MESSNGHIEKTEDEDRLSLLTDDILLSILGRVNITTAARTCVLSSRWKHLPWLLQDLTMDAKDFLPAPIPNPIEPEHISATMASLTKAVRSFLATHQHEATISSLQLKIYLVDNYSEIIGPLLSEAIGIGTIKDLDLAILDEKEPDDCYDSDVLQHARSVDGFFSVYPGVVNCLTRLSLFNVCFAEWDLNHFLFDCCKQLRYLYLFNCDTGGFPSWKIHAPDSNVRVLELDTCILAKLEVLHLPKLERLRWECWMCPNAPVSLGVVPSLKELYLLCSATVYFKGFKLSEVLGDSTVQNLTLNFQGEKLWMQPEGKELCTAFSKLKKLSLHDIFVEFDLLWTIFLLEAAPTVEIFDVEIWEHPCTMGPEARGKTFGERPNPLWKLSKFRSGKEWLLKEVQITGFSSMDQQMTFIRAVMERAPNLRSLVLKDYAPCEDCEQMGVLPRSERLPTERVFPKGKEEQHEVVNQLIGDMAYCHVEIVFVI